MTIIQQATGKEKLTRALLALKKKKGKKKRRKNKIWLVSQAERSPATSRFNKNLPPFLAFSMTPKKDVEMVVVLVPKICEYLNAM